MLTFRKIVEKVFVVTQTKQKILKTGEIVVSEKGAFLPQVVGVGVSREGRFLFRHNLKERYLCEKLGDSKDALNLLFADSFSCEKEKFAKYLNFLESL
jgi:hypothetical protein